MSHLSLVQNTPKLSLIKMHALLEKGFFSNEKPSDETDKCLRLKGRQQQKLQDKTFSDKQKLTYIITPISIQNRSNDLSLTSDDSTFCFESK